MTVSPAGTKGRNRLDQETSPYLLQHKNNPVHWWAWGEDAFAAARAQDKPIFLSIGYSTCYWCHVMERESFENEQIAAVMNEHFICIKVDREERPDVDDIYMASVHILNQGRGGWPMSVFLEPETLKPFLAGTYFPPEDRYGRPGFPSVLEQVADYWSTHREQVLQQAGRVAEMVIRQLTIQAQTRSIDAEHVDRAATVVMAGYDKDNGGFGSSPKFPTPVNLDFLSQAAWDLQASRRAVVYTLDRMAMGGMYDQIGGGFHRYSTDEKWLVPHFEKMLYDNGQLAQTYAKIYERTEDPYYAVILRETLEYVLREMTSPAGAFYSAQDAEVNHREGGNYLWLADEVRTALIDAGLDDDVDFALEVYGLNEGTNFKDPHQPDDQPKNVVYLTASPRELAERAEITLDEFFKRTARIKVALLEVRVKRDQPSTDDKVLAGWNGLMIAGMADGGRVLGEAHYIDAAGRAADFVISEMRSDDGGLLRTHRDGRAKIDGFLVDYAYMIHGLLALHRAAGDEKALTDAVMLTDVARERFWDDSAGAYFDTLPDQSDLFVRVKSTYDGATASGNGVMLNNLIDLHELTGAERFMNDAIATVEALSHALVYQPTGTVTSMKALSRLMEKDPEFLTASGMDGIDEKKPLRISVSQNSLRLAVGAESAVQLNMRLEPGYHINSHEPGIDYLIPLEISVSGGDGIEVTADYPPGEHYDGPAGVMYVHADTVAVPLTIRRVGEITGRPRIMVTYQICTEQACLQPQTEPIPLGVIAE